MTVVQLKILNFVKSNEDRKVVESWIGHGYTDPKS